MKNIFERALTENDYVDSCGIGNIRIADDGAIYRWVANAETATDFTAGEPVFHKMSDGANAHKYINAPATALLMFLAGIVVSTDGIKQNSGTNPKRYGWIQIRGYNSSTNISNTTNVTYTAGSYLKGVNAATYLTYNTTITPSYPRNVQVLEDVGTHTTPAIAKFKTFINCIG